MLMCAINTRIQIGRFVPQVIADPGPADANTTEPDSRARQATITSTYRLDVPA